MQLDLAFLVRVVINVGTLDTGGSFFLFQSCGISFYFLDVVRRRGRRPVVPLYAYASYGS